MLITTLKFKKLGDMWYLDTKHDDPYIIQMPYKVNKYLTFIDTYNDGYVDIDIMQQGIIIHSLGLIEFKDSDITRYLEGKDAFLNMTVKINGHTFRFNSLFFKLLEKNYDIDIARDVYRIII